MTTVDFYKERVNEAKLQFESELFKDDRKHVEVEIQGQKWKEFTPEVREDVFKINGANSEQRPSFEDPMIMDTIKAMRRDRREQKQKGQSK